MSQEVTLELVKAFILTVEAHFVETKSDKHSTLAIYSAISYIISH